MSDPCPPCLVWLPLMHRIASVENGNIIFLSYLQFLLKQYLNI